MRPTFVTIRLLHISWVMFSVKGFWVDFWHASKRIPFEGCQNFYHRVISLFDDVFKLEALLLKQFLPSLMLPCALKTVFKAMKHVTLKSLLEAGFLCTFWARAVSFIRGPIAHQSLCIFTISFFLQVPSIVPQPPMLLGSQAPQLVPISVPGQNGQSQTAYTLQMPLPSQLPLAPANSLDLGKQPHSYTNGITNLDTNTPIMDCYW